MFSLPRDFSRRLNAGQFIPALLVFGVLLSGAGCTGLSEMRYRHTQKHRTCAAWRCYDAASSCHYGCDYEAGWKAGYYDVLTGGCGQPPVVAPRKYWDPKQIINDCDQKRHRWYVGFQDGAAAAKRCPDTHYLKLWMPPSCRPGIEACPVGPGPAIGTDLTPTSSPVSLGTPLPVPAADDDDDEATDLPAPPEDGEETDDATGDGPKMPSTDGDSADAADNGKNGDEKADEKKESGETFAERLRRIAEQGREDETADETPMPPAEDDSEFGPSGDGANPQLPLERPSPLVPNEPVPNLNPLIPPQTRTSPHTQPSRRPLPKFDLGSTPVLTGGKRSQKTTPVVPEQIVPGQVELGQVELGEPDADWGTPVVEATAVAADAAAAAEVADTAAAGRPIQAELLDAFEAAMKATADPAADEIATIEEMTEAIEDEVPVVEIPKNVPRFTLGGPVPGGGKAVAPAVEVTAAPKPALAASPVENAIKKPATQAAIVEVPMIDRPAIETIAEMTAPATTPAIAAEPKTTAPPVDAAATVSIEELFGADRPSTQTPTKANPVFELGEAVRGGGKATLPAGKRTAQTEQPQQAKPRFELGETARGGGKATLPAGKRTAEATPTAKPQFQLGTPVEGGGKIRQVSY